MTWAVQLAVALCLHHSSVASRPRGLAAEEHTLATDGSFSFLEEHQQLQVASDGHQVRVPVARQAYPAARTTPHRLKIGQELKLLREAQTPPTGVAGEAQMPPTGAAGVSGAAQPGTPQGVAGSGSEAALTPPPAQGGSSPLAPSESPNPTQADKDLFKTLNVLRSLRNFSFGADIFGMPLPVPPGGKGECTARTVALHLEGARDRLLDKTTDPHTDEVMIALIVGSLVTLFFGHMLITPVLALVTGGVAFYVAFVMALHATQSCDTPVWAGIIAMVPVALIVTRILRLGFFALGFSLGMILAIEGQSFLFSAFPALPDTLREKDLLQYDWAFLLVVSLAMGFFLMGQLQNVTMFATALVGAFGLERGITGLGVSYDMEMSKGEGFVCVAAFFFIGVVVQVWLASCSRTK